MQISINTAELTVLFICVNVVSTVFTVATKCEACAHSVQLRALIVDPDPAFASVLAKDFVPHPVMTFRGSRGRGSSCAVWHRSSS